MLAYYRTVDVFVCLSEHEGFGVPVLEAMALDLPVVAHRAAALAETAGAGARLLEDKDPLVVACAVAELLSDDGARAEQLRAGRARAAELDLPSAHQVCSPSSEGIEHPAGRGRLLTALA